MVMRNVSQNVSHSRAIVGKGKKRVQIVTHIKSEAFILKQLHLGGNILKQKCAPGINNAYAHCEAWCKDDCKFIVLHFDEKH